MRQKNHKRYLLWALCSVCIIYGALYGVRTVYGHITSRPVIVQCDPLFSPELCQHLIETILRGDSQSINPGIATITTRQTPGTTIVSVKALQPIARINNNLTLNSLGSLQNQSTLQQDALEDLAVFYVTPHGLQLAPDDLLKLVKRSLKKNLPELFEITIDSPEAIILKSRDKKVTLLSSHDTLPSIQDYQIYVQAWDLVQQKLPKKKNSTPGLVADIRFNKQIVFYQKEEGYEAT